MGSQIVKRGSVPTKGINKSKRRLDVGNAYGNICEVQKRWAVCSSLGGLHGLGDGGHRLGGASLLAATAAPLLGLLGLFLDVEGRQRELLSHDGHTGRSRRFLEVGSAKLLVKVLAKEVGVADIGAGRAAVLQRIARGPGRIGTGGSLARRSAGAGEGAVERAR